LHDASREARLAIERFLKASLKPVLMEPGEDPLAITPDTFVLTTRGAAFAVECWNETHHIVRRVRGIKLEKTGRLVLEIERFGGRTGLLSLIDMGRPSNSDAPRRGARLKYRERFRESLHRQFPDWRIVELSAEPDLEHSFSPSFPRALLRKGLTGLAAIGAPQEASRPEDALTFGLIWLDYLRHREQRLVMEGLAIFLPAGTEATTCHRVRYLNPKAARFLIYVHAPPSKETGGWEQRVNPNDYTNLETVLDFHKTPLGEAPLELIQWAEKLDAIPGVERRSRPDGSVSFAVRGLEFARADTAGFFFGLEHKRTIRTEADLAEVLELARGLARMRHPDAADKRNPLYTRRPEAWLESQVRDQLDAIDASLFSSPVYCQVPEMAGGSRGILDLVAADHRGRLAIIELKASQDMHLALQALDYWMRVKWHVERNEFAQKGYFPGIALIREPPRLLLVAPALDWHPTTEAILKYFDPGIDVTRVGIGLKWKRGVNVMFRSGAKQRE
jgi:hypothetical protein